MAEVKKTTEKEYQITLKTSELEFIRDVLGGINDLMNHLNGTEGLTHEFERGLELISPVELEEKIFKQFYDEDGELR